ncbi:MAG: substrate-binding domain-containing protein [Verrucomicrobiales bacterium]|nr:substrate-binding domain-containing protein [Verrucomicrobiales bacterium]
MRKLILLLSCSAAFLSPSVEAETPPIRLAGSDTLGAKLVPNWIEAYRLVHPEFEFTVSAEGTSTGFTALAEERCDIAMASRRIKPSENSRHLEKRGQPISSHLVALSPLALIVHETNPVTDLSLEQVRKIYAGRIKNWKDVGGPDLPISTYSRNTSSGSYLTFRNLVMRDSDFSPDLQKLAG